MSVEAENLIFKVSKENKLTRKVVEMNKK